MSGNGFRAVSDYVLAGVDFEEAGEKWRGGDAAKVCSPWNPCHVTITDDHSRPDSL